jgi:acyl-CoA synthetase (AMP-forming)/AMP-acid ligase II
MRTSSPDTIARYSSRGWWGDTTIYDMFARNAARAPDRLAVVDPPNRADLVGGEPLRLTYRELSASVERLAGYFLRQELAAGDVVVTQLPNIVEYVVVYLAAARLGLVVSPVPMQYRDHELRHIVGLLAPAAYVTCDSFKGADCTGLAAAVTSGLRTRVLTLGAAACGARSIELGTPGAADPVAAHVAAHPVSANDIYTICWTSGTEGVPKGVPRSHNHWIAISSAHYEGAQLREGDRLLNPFPLVNMGAIGGCFMSWLLGGGTLILHHPLDLAVYLRQVATEQADYAIAPPAVLNMLLKNESLLATADLSSLRCIGSGSAPLAPWMIEGYRDRFGIDIVNMFGANEGVSFVSGPREIADPALRAKYFPRLGRPEIDWSLTVSRMIETRIVDPDSSEEVVEPGRPGEMQVRGPMVFDGYFKSPALTRKAFTDDGYYRTGDLFQIASGSGEARYYEFVGRLKQLIVRGGMKISPEELDDLLCAHPDIADGAAVGVPDTVLGERVCAVVVPRQGASISVAALQEYLKSRGVAVYKWPERLIVTDLLPRNPMGKVVRAELARLATADAG